LDALYLFLTHRPGGSFNCWLPGNIPGSTGSYAHRQLEDIYEASGFFSLPDVLLPQVPAETMKVLDRKDAILGSHNARVSPLKMALAASALTNNGDRPAPRIAMAVKYPCAGLGDFTCRAENSSV
jgi:hypothetical protein